MLMTAARTGKVDAVRVLLDARRRCAREGTAARADRAHVGGGGRARRGHRRAHQGRGRFPDAARLRILAADVRRAPGTYRRRQGAAEGGRRRQRSRAGARESRNCRKASGRSAPARRRWISRSPTGISSWRQSCSMRAPIPNSNRLGYTALHMLVYIRQPGYRRQRSRPRGLRQRCRASSSRSGWSPRART